jgi:hypothetical protein
LATVNDYYDGRRRAEADGVFVEILALYFREFN